MAALTGIVMMTEAEARENVQEINSRAADMGRRLLELRDREGWKALGYATWTACLEGEFSYSRKHLYELMHAAPILERLLPAGNTISTSAAAALAGFPEELQPAIVQIARAEADALGKRLTEGLIARTGSVLMQAVQTGVVDVNGEATPFSAALIEEETEAIKRQKQYIHENNGGPTLKKRVEVNVLFVSLKGADLRFSVGSMGQVLKPDTPYVLRVYEEVEDKS